MKKVLAFLVPLLVLLLAACSSGAESSQDSEAGYSESTGDKAVSNTDNTVVRNGATEENKATEETKNKNPLFQTERKIIYNADLELTVEKLDETKEKIESLTSEHGGYIVQSSYFTDENKIQHGSVTVRVPSNKFKSFLAFASDLSKGNPRQSINGQDVTEEYVDLESRLKAKEAVRERLESFLKNAEKTEDLLAISDDLGQVQEEIEQLQGRITYLKNQSDYATVSISIIEKNVNVPGFQNGEELNTWQETKKLFMMTVNGIVAFFSKAFVFLVGLSPVFVPLVIILGILFYFRKKRKTAEQ
ncbi:DUF4349 domain-containing protein [Pseudalkalibacillus caeni]|nr:DUF4349 domain-containing protein [Pseudalkalibacillus caeni]